MCFEITYVKVGSNGSHPLSYGSSLLELVKRDKAFFVTRKRPFNKEDLSTIETNIIEYHG